MGTLATSSTVCSLCGELLHGSDGCLACLLRVGLADSSEEEATLPGSLVFGDFEIERREDGTLWELGRGAMGTTYRARDRMLHRQVALKVIEIAAEAERHATRERFLREARAAAALRHANIASVFQIGAPNDTDRCYYAMELVEGETLATLVRRDGPLPVAAALDLAIQVARALVAAAAHNLVHRDLKPANIMLAPNEAAPARLDAKVIDFGLAKATAGAADTMDLTHGAFVGTPNFASPEQFAGQSADARSDIYSLGATLWYALTGDVPFRGKTIEEIRAAQKDVRLPVQELTARKVPTSLIRLLQRSLASNPESRPQSARTLLSELEACRELTKAAPRRRKVAFFMGLLALGTAGLTTYLRYHPVKSVTVLAQKSIAVLPFENLNNDKENSLFADGVHDQVLTDLAMVADLKVISRTSVMQYKSPLTLGRRDIAQQLGVAHVLEGSVQRTNGKVRINVQLINAGSDAREWAATYDRPVGEVFAIQSEMASAVANQLQAKISYNEKVAMLAAPTTDLVASALYQQALALQEKFPYHTSELESVGLLDEAVARDPHFIRAYYLLGQVHIILYTGGYDHTSARRELARAAIQNAARLQPEAGEVHLAWARYAYYCTNDYDRARAELDLARHTLPNDAEVYFTSAVLDRVQGRWDDAIKNAKRSVELDPRNRQHVLLAAGVYSCLRRYAEAQPFLDLALELPPKDYYNRVSYVELPFAARADIQPMRKELSAILEEDSGAEAKIADELFHCALLERDPLAAARAVAAIPAERLHPREWYAGLADRTFNNPVAARNSFNAARPIVEKIVHGQPDYAQAWSLLGKIDAALGRREDAIREGRHACELLPLSKNALRGAGLITDLATIYAWIGEKDLALEQLTISAREPGGVSYGELKLEPQWDSLRGDPRFAKIVASLAPK